MTAWELCGISGVVWRSLPLDIRLRLAASCHLGYRYGSGRFPYGGGCIPGNLVRGERTTNCSTFAAALLCAAYPDAPWAAADYRDLQIYDAARPLSPLDAVERVGAGTRTQAPMLARWHLVQGWRASGSGHAFLALTTGDRTLQVLQASSVGKAGPTLTTTTVDAVIGQYPRALGWAVLR